MTAHPRIPDRRRRRPGPAGRPLPSPDRMSAADAAAAILSMTATTVDEAELRRLAGALRRSMPERPLMQALDEAAWRVARLIDLCVTPLPDPADR